MVKPTLKPEPEKQNKADDLKDDKLKEWGILPNAVVIDETEKEKDKKDAEAALADVDVEVDDAPRPFIAKFCACFAVFTILLIVTCTVGSFLYFHGNSHHKWKGWCSVKYDGDGDHDDSHERGHPDGRHDGRHGGKSSSEERPKWHYPRPTGPPGGQRTCNQQTEVDVDQQLERIERPAETDCERLTILHDYNANISTYRLWKSEICYVTWIDDEVLMDPVEFWTNMQDPEYLNQYFSELTMTYRAVLPEIPKPLHEQENGKYGEYLDGPKEFLCEGAETYWIEKIPEEELEEFMQLIEQIIQELMQLAAAEDQQQQQGDQHHGQWMPDPTEDGGQGGDMPQWPGIGGHPWEDKDDREEGMEHGWPMGYHGQHDGRNPSPYGGHDQGRKRRSLRKQNKLKKKNNRNPQAEKAKRCLATGTQYIRQLASNEKISSMKVFSKCFMELAETLKKN